MLLTCLLKYLVIICLLKCLVIIFVSITVVLLAIIVAVVAIVAEVYDCGVAVVCTSLFEVGKPTSMFSRSQKGDKGYYYIPLIFLLS